MKRLGLPLLTACLLLGMLAGCGGQAPPATEAAPSAEPADSPTVPKQPARDLSLADFQGFWRLNVEASARVLRASPEFEKLTRPENMVPAFEQIREELTYEIIGEQMISRRNDQRMEIDLSVVSSNAREVVVDAVLADGMQGRFALRFVEGQYLQVDDGVPMSLGMFIMERAEKPDSLD